MIVDVLVLELGGMDMVLGVAWLSKGWISKEFLVDG